MYICASSYAKGKRHRIKPFRGLKGERKVVLKKCGVKLFHSIRTMSPCYGRRKRVIKFSHGYTTAQACIDFKSTGSIITITGNR